jgi:hypothetical protein
MGMKNQFLAIAPKMPKNSFFKERYKESKSLQRYEFLP